MVRIKSGRLKHKINDLQKEESKYTKSKEDSMGSRTQIMSMTI